MQLLMETFDDQVLINSALKQCSILWQKSSTDSYVRGICQNLGLRVALLPAAAVCRQCVTNGQYYVWHQKGARRQEDKKMVAKKGGVWFLQLNLDQSELTGIEWLTYLHASA